MSSRSAFYVHATVVVLCLVVGMSESYSWLAWAKVFIPLVTPMMAVNLVLPFVILVLAIREHRSQEGIAAVVALSAALSVAWFFAILPLCM